jgi:type II secretory pathway pseudopilin PulG
MKKILSFILIISLLISSATVAYAKQEDKVKQQKAEQKTEDLETKQAAVQQKKQTTITTTGTTATTKATTKATKKSTQKAVKAVKVTKQSFKIAGSPVIKYGKYKLPIRPITKGMGATEILIRIPLY